MTDSLAGQLWFGAECLAAGSSIMNKESESDAMRPLAKAVVKSMDKVRALLREQCLTPQPEYSEKIRENLKIFDRLFAEFEYSYVQCMVHVKSEKEYMLHQDLIILFSETLQRAIKNNMILQEMVDFYEPSLMFAIPRLAIVNGLLISPHGPLNVDRSGSDFPDLFLPFRNLLKKIRELLLTLAPHEVLVLEMLLCQHEEPANISNKLKEVERMLETREKTMEGQMQAEKLQEKLNDCDKRLRKKESKDKSRSSKSKRAATASCDEEDESVFVVQGILDDLLDNVFRDDAPIEATPHSLPQHPASPSTVPMLMQVREVEIDCTGPEIRVSPRRESTSSSSSTTTAAAAATSDVVQSSSSSSKDPTAASTSGIESAPSTYHSPRPKQRLKRHNAKRDAKRIPVRYQKDRRAKFKSTEDLLHRLYVCISGAADQLQSNYAGDFRSILRNVFIMNTSADDDDEEEDDLDEEEEESRTAPASSSGAVREGDHPSVSSSEDTTPSSPSREPLRIPPSVAGGASAAAAAAPSGSSSEFPTSHSLPNAFSVVDVATDALQQEISNSLINEQLRSCSSSDDLEAGSPRHAEGSASGSASSFSRPSKSSSTTRSSMGATAAATAVAAGDAPSAARGARASGIECIDLILRTAQWTL